VYSKIHRALRKRGGGGREKIKARDREKGREIGADPLSLLGVIGLLSI
jgi:hypothetical protein